MNTIMAASLFSHPNSWAGLTYVKKQKYDLFLNSAVVKHLLGGSLATLGKVGINGKFGRCFAST